MNIIYQIFKKENGITYNDLKSLVGSYQETSKVECKGNITKGNFDKSVIRPVIGFLNKPEEPEGLLILGVKASKGVIEDICMLNTNEFYGQDSLRNQILDTIKSIPSSERTYSMDVLKIVNPNESHKDAFLIEVKKEKYNAVFYSKNDYTSYIRKSDTTKELSLSEIFQIAQERSNAIVIPILKHLHVSCYRSLYFYQFNIGLHNSGTSPGRDIVLILKFRYLNGNGGCIIEKIEGFNVIVPEGNYFKRLERDLMQNNSKPLYPYMELEIGRFMVKLFENTEIEIETDAYENHGVTVVKWKVSHGEVCETYNAYKPYLS